MIQWANPFLFSDGILLRFGDNKLPIVVRIALQPVKPKHESKRVEQILT